MAKKNAFPLFSRPLTARKRPFMGWRRRSKTLRDSARGALYSVRRDAVRLTLRSCALSGHTRGGLSTRWPSEDPISRDPPDIHPKRFVFQYGLRMQTPFGSPASPASRPGKESCCFCITRNGSGLNEPSPQSLPSTPKYARCTPFWGMGRKPWSEKRGDWKDVRL